MDRGAWRAIVHGVPKSLTEHAHTHTRTHTHMHTQVLDELIIRTRMKSFVEVMIHYSYYHSSTYQKFVIEYLREIVLN